MDHRTLYSIGDLARRTGLPVRTIRFYSDAGVLPPTYRSSANHRRYDLTAVARLELIRTLRELGVDLASIHRVLAEEITVSEAAIAHAEALDVQIRVLRLRRAVLRVVAKRDVSPEEMKLMHRIAQLSEAERHRLINDFVDSTFGGVDANPELMALLRSAVPDLPDEPTAEQVECWIELAELVQDSDFRASVRRMAEHQAAERAAGDRTGLHHDLTNHVRDQVAAAVAAGIQPASAQAGLVVSELVARYADTFGAVDSPEYRAQMVTRLTIANDPRVERYWHLIATINGSPTMTPLAPIFSWFIEALQRHPSRH
ncbi:DNA-binding transcriptional MerR regulator [Actinoplanes octamycinicus]|uniref:DNA-binding transcriptional MerR regulator n=1 Tax=Actinoplanes octamycinicus TaxID=135948 RepID=A0A7W7H4V7_9ACTN|nr:MerR family transcriptional regulator [Actinoplanes octamycinicus]MBB4744055.1 DNA-binding transcriptional MerR regulator [Actinoplanes octamycinicus]